MQANSTAVFHQSTANSTVLRTFKGLDHTQGQEELKKDYNITGEYVVKAKLKYTTASRSKSRIYLVVVGLILGVRLLDGDAGPVAAPHLPSRSVSQPHQLATSSSPVHPSI